MALARKLSHDRKFNWCLRLNSPFIIRGHTYIARSTAKGNHNYYHIFYIFKLAHEWTDLNGT